MKIADRKIAANALIYAFGDLATKAARFIMLPLYVRLLTKEEVGQLALAQAVFIGAWTLFSLSSGFAVRRYFFEFPHGSPVANNMVRHIWLWRTLVSLPFMLLSLLAVFLWFDSPVDTLIFSLAILAGYFRGAHNVSDGWLVACERATAYRVFGFCYFVTGAVISLILVAGFDIGVTGVMVGELVAALIFALISFFLVWSSPKSETPFSMEYKRVLNYVLPIIPHTFALWFLMSGDRFFLSKFFDSRAVAEYDVGIVSASCLSIIAMAFRAAWLPDFFRNGATKEGRDRYAGLSIVYIGVMAIICLLAASYGPFLLGWLFGGNYEESTKIFFWGLSAMFIFSIYLVLNQPLYFYEKTGLILVSSLSGAVINFIVIFLFLRDGGWWIAILAKAGSYLVMAVLAERFVVRKCPIPWQWARTLMLLGVFIVVYALIGCADMLPAVSGGILKTVILISGSLVIFAILSRKRYVAIA